MMMPSSTHAMVVVWAPMSTTQALERPAPNVAHIASYPKESAFNKEGRRERGEREERGKGAMGDLQDPDFGETHVGE